MAVIARDDYRVQLDSAFEKTGRAHELVNALALLAADIDDDGVSRFVYRLRQDVEQLGSKLTYLRKRNGPSL